MNMPRKPEFRAEVELFQPDLARVIDGVQAVIAPYLKLTKHIGEIKLSTLANGSVQYEMIPAGFDIGAGDTMLITNDHNDAIEVKFFDSKVFGLVQLLLPDGCKTLLTVNDTAVQGQLQWDYSDNSGGGTQPITVRPPK